MSNFIGQLVSFTVAIPLVMGLARMNRIRASFQPFLLLLLMAFTSELVSMISIQLTQSNTISLNIYTLLEAGVILLQFYAWGFLRKKPQLLYLLIVIYLVVWSVENILLGGISTGFSSHFVMVYSLVTVLLSINEINSLITSFSGNLFRDSRFLICAGFIIMGVYSLVTEGLLLVAHHFIIEDLVTKALAQKIFTLFIIINAFVNIVYAFAVYYMPVREDYYFSRRFKA
ncbi:hypothetical protein ACWKWU_20675 [Chitinophaga lutea]